MYNAFKSFAYKCINAHRVCPSICYALKRSLMCPCLSQTAGPTSQCQVTLTKHTEQCPSCEDNSRSADKVIYRLLWISLFHYSVHKYSPLSTIRSHMIPIPSIPPQFLTMHLVSIPLHQSIQSGLNPLGFMTKTLYASLISPTRARCPDCLILLDFTILLASTL